MRTPITDQVVILTGASRGIGAALARSLGARGARLVLAARDADQLAAVAREVEGAGGSARVIPCDVTRADHRRALLDEALAWGPLAALINNAGVEVPLAVQDQPEADVARQLDVNLLAPIELTRIALPHLIAQRRGAVVMVSSMSGKSPTPYNAVYSATKYGINGFTASLRLELLGTGVRAGVVCPSFVAGEGMWASTGLRAPSLMREVPISQVIAGVEAVIDGAPQVLVTPSPVRPLLALAQLFPSLDGALLRALGVLRILKDRAAVAAAQRRA
jgi:short-subunit dehydrogenase